MVIGYDGSRAFGTNRTGTENYSYQLLKALSQIDHTNSYYIYLRPGNITPKDWPSNFHFRTLKYPRLWTQAGLALQTFIDPLDVLFIPAHTLPLIRKPGLKTVLTVHDLGAEYLPAMHQLKQRLYLGLMTKYQLQSASHLIAVSNSTKQDLVSKIKIPGKKISVIHEGYDENLKPVKGESLNSILNKYDIEKDRYFLFVGTIQPRKNLSRLIEAYAKVCTDNFPKLVLAGGKGWMSDDIFKLPEKLGLKDKVKFLGYVPDKDLPGLLTGAIGFVYPSLFEGFGLPVLEAFQCQCPVLTSNVSSLPEVAGDAAILVDPYSVEEIARGLIELAKPATAKRLNTQAQKQLNKFSWTKAAKETLAVLNFD